MKILCFKFQQNRTINKEFDFFEGGNMWQGDPNFLIVISITTGKYMKMLCFKYQQNENINE